MSALRVLSQRGNKMDFIKDYGSIILTAIGGIFVLVWKAAHVVRQVAIVSEKVDEQNEIFNKRLERLEEHFNKLDEKLDRILLCQKI